MRARHRRREAALVAGVERDLAVPLEQDVGEREVDLGGDLQRLEHRVGAHRHDDELLEVEVVRGVPAAVDQVDQRHREDVAVGVQVPVERPVRGRRRGAGGRQRDAEHRVGAEAGLVVGAVELDQRRRRARAGRRRSGRPAPAAISPLTLADRPEDAEAAEALAAVAQLERLVGAGRAAGRDVGAAQRAAVEADVDLDGGQAAAVEHLAGADGGDPRSPGNSSLTGLPPRGWCRSPASRALVRLRRRRRGGCGRAPRPRGVAVGDRREQLRVLGGDLRGAVVVRAELDHAEQDLRLHAAVGADRGARCPAASMIARWNLMSGSTTSRHGAPSGSAESSSTAWRAPSGTPPDAMTMRTASISSAVRSRKMSTMSAASSTGDLDAAVRLAAQQALGDQDLGRGAERVAGDAEALGELRLAQAAAGLERRRRGSARAARWRRRRRSRRCSDAGRETGSNGAPQLPCVAFFHN